MKKCERKTLCTNTTKTAQANTQHYKLHTHENDHRLNADGTDFIKADLHLLFLNTFHKFHECLLNHTVIR